MDVIGHQTSASLPFQPPELRLMVILSKLANNAYSATEKITWINEEPYKTAHSHITKRGTLVT